MGKRPITRNTQEILLTPKNQGQQDYIDTIVGNIITFIDAKPGSGKTIIPVYLAVKSIRAGLVNKIVITRPAIEAQEHLGYLKGNLDEKMSVYTIPIMDELQKFVSRSELEFWKNDGILEVAPLAFMRGRTFLKTFILADEMQNANYEQIKMLLTRIGEGSKLVVNGDSGQSDLPHNKRGGLQTFIHILKGVKGVGIAELTEVVRHPIIADILDKISEHERNDV